MNDRFAHELSPMPAARVEAMRAQPPAQAIERAQHRLMQRVRATPVPARVALRAPWLAAATAAALALVAIIAIPLLSNTSNAFAAVQRHFLRFDTLSMRVEQRVDGNTLQTSHMVVDARGVLRTDVGRQLSVIVDPPASRVLTLLHGPRRAMLMPLQGARASPDAALDWLEQLRRFKGEAEPLPETRTIQGRVARGWALDIGGNSIVLWADASGLPLSMEMDPPGGLEIEYQFRFDEPVPAGHLSSEVPRGYRLAEPDPH